MELALPNIHFVAAGAHAASTGVGVVAIAAPANNISLQEKIVGSRRS